MTNSLISGVWGKGLRVWKFGGSSLKSADRIQQVVKLIVEHGLEAQNGPQFINGTNADSLVVVVSAIAGVTNLLVQSCTASKKKGRRMDATFVMDRLSVLDEIVVKHQCVVGELVQQDAINRDLGLVVIERIRQDCFTKIRSLLEASSIIGNVPVKIAEIIKGFGEIWSSMILSLCLKQYLWTSKTSQLVEMAKEISDLDDEACPNVCLAYEEGRTPLKANQLHSVTASTDDSDDSENNICVAVLGSPWNCQNLIQLQKPFLADESPTVDMEATKKMVQTRLQNEMPRFQALQSAIASNASTDASHIKTRFVRFATGYVCCDHEGASTTLGRNGSDYTGAILASCLGAASYTIWSDVEGVFTADPRIIPEARCVPFLTFEEAMELSFFGASVIHPLTMQPLISADVPIFMKSSYQPQKEGTVICREGRASQILRALKGHDHEHISPVSSPSKSFEHLDFGGVELKDLNCKSITTVGDISMITIIGAVMTARRGLSRRMFATLDELDIQVLMICQASSSYGVSLAIKSSDVAKSIEALEKEFFGELIRWSTFKIKVVHGLAMLCTVGENQRNKIGYFAQVTSAIAEVEASIVSCVQSPSERLIAFVINEDDRKKVVRQLHKTLFPHLTELQKLPEANSKCD